VLRRLRSPARHRAPRPELVESIVAPARTPSVRTSRCPPRRAPGNPPARPQLNIRAHPRRQAAA
jgi:hypothetical protein